MDNSIMSGLLGIATHHLLWFVS